MCAVSPAQGASNLGAINTAQEDKAGVVFRLVPLVRQGINDYLREDDFEVHAFFVFHGATPKGSSSEPFNFDTDNGVLRFKGKTQPYIAAGLLSIIPQEGRASGHLRRTAPHDHLWRDCRSPRR